MKGLKDISLTPRERAGIQAAARALQEQLPINQVILFGSKARGDSHSDSDIDLLLLTRHRFSLRERDAVRDILSNIEDEHEIRFGTVSIPEDDWYHGVYQVLPLRDEVDRDGVAT